ncbi:MAG: hypothetical protein NTX22_10485 [Ignavibacteriales bacterium]|nr:hypothetical protein [Ignavibacteriales bacterium]
MKDRIILISLILAVVSLALGLIGKLTSYNIYFSNSTWHMFAQTSLLFAIAWGIGKYLVIKEK